MANQGGTYAMCSEDCCFFVNQSGKLQNNLRNTIDKANKFYKEGARGRFDCWDFKTNIWSCFSCLTPFLGPIAALLLLLLGHCLLRYLLSFIQQSVQALGDSFCKQPLATPLAFQAIQFHPLPLNDPYPDPQAGTTLCP